MSLLPLPQDEPRDPRLAEALAAVAVRIAPERVDQVWLFPPRRLAARESGLAVLVVVPDEDGGERREIWTVRYDGAMEKGKPVFTHLLEAQGTVPPDRVGRIVDGVARRLEAESDAPDVRDTGGDPEAWAALLAELGAPAVVDAPNR
ncbi:MAG TPA: hypothetical protein VJT67_15775 [Longimicrobiaceae bacterium]|nr:hypothetical protein [Longimicrobiaceae bacterium]